MNKRDVERAIKAKLEIQKTLIQREEQPPSPKPTGTVKTMADKLASKYDEAAAIEKQRTKVSKEIEHLTDELRDAGWNSDRYWNRSTPADWYDAKARDAWYTAKNKRIAALVEIAEIDLPLTMATITLQGEDSLPTALADLIARIESI